MYKVLKEECRTEEWKRVVDLQFHRQYDRIIYILESLTGFEIDIEEVAEKFKKEFPDHLEKHINSRKEIERRYVE